MKSALARTDHESSREKKTDLPASTPSAVHTGRGALRWQGWLQLEVAGVGEMPRVAWGLGPVRLLAATSRLPICLGLCSAWGLWEQ